MFESITKNFSGVLDRIRGKKYITEDELNTTLREIRMALLEADVALPMVKEIINDIKTEALGREIIKNTNAGQMIVKIVNDKLLQLFGEELGDINLDGKPTIIMMAGLQGSGKTTTAAKLARRFKDKFNKKILLVSLDIYRPAAQEQLETLAKTVGVDSLPIVKDEKPLEIVARAMPLINNYDAVIFDTAGRLQVDEELMQELMAIKQKIKPQETILVADSLMGQEAVNVAREFNEKIVVDSIVLTRIDGDGRGGAALSMKMATSRSIRYIGTGEKLEDFDLFHSKRIVSRILDMGDIVSFVEKAEAIVDKEEAEKMQTKFMRGNFDFNDLLKQLKNINKLGGIVNIIGFLPGASKLREFIKDKGFDEKEMKKQEAIIFSMTMAERSNPDLLNSSRKFRIAAGSGTKIQDVNSLVKKLKTMRQVASKISGMDENQLKGIMKNLGDNEGALFKDEA